MNPATIRLKRPRDPLADQIAILLVHLRNAKIRRCIIRNVKLKAAVNGSA